MQTADLLKRHAFIAILLLQYKYILIFRYLMQINDMVINYNNNNNNIAK